jgi:hypothetical protein
LFAGGQVFVKIHVFISPEIVKEEFDGQNPPWRIHEVPKAIRSHRGAGELRQHSSSARSGKSDRRIRTNEGRWITHKSHLGVSGGEGSKPL